MIALFSQITSLIDCWKYLIFVQFMIEGIIIINSYLSSKENSPPSSWFIRQHI